MVLFVVLCLVIPALLSMRPRQEIAAGGGSWASGEEQLKTPTLTFADVGLAPDTSDSLAWQLCQGQGLVLVTANRNDDGPDSLEATLRKHNTATSLPVITLADPEGIRHSGAYAEQTV